MFQASRQPRNAIHGRCTLIQLCRFLLGRCSARNLNCPCSSGRNGNTCGVEKCLCAFRYSIDLCSDSAKQVCQLKRQIFDVLRLIIPNNREVRIDLDLHQKVPFPAYVTDTPSSSWSPVKSNFRRCQRAEDSTSNLPAASLLVWSATNAVPSTSVRRCVIVAVVGDTACLSLTFVAVV